MKASDRMLEVLTSAAEERLAQMEGGLVALAKAAPERRACSADDPPGGNDEDRRMIIAQIRALLDNLHRRVCALKGGRGTGDGPGETVADPLEVWRPNGKGGGC